MKFSIGDLIRVKNTGEEGKVVDLLDNDMVEVNINQTTFPVYEDEIEHPYFHWFTQKQKSKKISAATLIDNLPEEKKKKKHELVQFTPGCSLQFLPVYEDDGIEDVITKLKVYFINQTMYDIKVGYSCDFKQKNIFTHKAHILPYQSFYLHDISYADIQLMPDFSWEIYSMKEDFYFTFKDSMKIKPKKLFELLQKMQFQNEPTFTLQIAEVKQAEHIQTIFQNTEPEPAKDKDFWGVEKPCIKKEIDLHIEQLVKKHKYLDVFEIIQVQIEAFQKAMSDAILAQQDSLMIIHGIGNGKLKQEIHKLLRTEYAHCCYFIHDYMPKYGMGATQVIFN